MQLVNAKETGVVASMTGYATRDGTDGQANWSWDLRSVNGKGLDLRLRLPDGLAALEAALRKRLGQAVTRGNVTLALRMGRDAAQGDLTLNEHALARVLGHLSQLRAAAEDAGLPVAPVSPAELLSLRGVADAAEGADLPGTDVLMTDFEPVLAAWLAMRATEGAALAAIMHQQLDRIAALVDDAQAAAEARAEPQAARLKAAVETVLEATDIDAARLTQDIAVLAMKTDVTEEIDRLRAHVTAARDLLDRGAPVGRKLDFLMQEFNREANTLCSKAQDAALTAVGLDLKLTIDQMREQVQNVE